MEIYSFYKIFLKKSCYVGVLTKSVERDEKYRVFLNIIYNKAQLIIINKFCEYQIKYQNFLINIW